MEIFLLLSVFCGFWFTDRIRPIERWHTFIYTRKYAAVCFRIHVPLIFRVLSDTIA